VFERNHGGLCNFSSRSGGPVALAARVLPITGHAFLVHPVERVDFFATGVSQDQRGFILRETHPLPRDAPSQALAAQAHDQLQFPVADPYGKRLARRYRGC